MVEGTFPQIIDFDKLDKAVMFALEKVYVRELTLRTPKKTGFTASLWTSAKVSPFSYVITNPEGEIITYLEEGTRAHTVRPRSRKMLRFEIDEAPTFRTPEERQRFNEKGLIFFFNRTGQAVLGYERKGGKFYCYARKTEHPGFAARHFIKRILEDTTLENKFKQEIIARL